MSGTGIENWLLSTVFEAAVKGTIFGTTKAIEYASKQSWTSVHYVGRKVTLENSINRALQEYVEIGWLRELRWELCATGGSSYPLYETTDAFVDSGIVLDIYKDVACFFLLEEVTEAEMAQVGLKTKICLSHGGLSGKSKHRSSMQERLAVSCKRLGVVDPYSKFSKERRELLAYMDPIKIGAESLENAFLLEGCRRLRGQAPEIVLVLARVLGLAMLCDLTEISVNDIPQILGLSQMMESIARSRIAKLRKVDVAAILDSTHFPGHSSLGDFGRSTVLIGHVGQDGRKIVCTPDFADCCIAFEPLPQKQKQSVGREVHINRTWAQALSYSSPAMNKFGFWEQARHYSCPSTSQDIHGNIYGSGGPKSVRDLEVVKIGPSRVYVEPVNDKDTRKEKVQQGLGRLWGGIMGLACACDVPDPSKKLGLYEGNEAVKARASRGFVAGVHAGYTAGRLCDDLRVECTHELMPNHESRLQRRSVGILWRPGDWVAGKRIISAMQHTLYLQGLAECLYCAVEQATKLGCREVVACGGGRNIVPLKSPFDGQKHLMRGVVLPERATFSPATTNNDVTGPPCSEESGNANATISSIKQTPELSLATHEISKPMPEDPATLDSYRESQASISPIKSTSEPDIGSVEATSVVPSTRRGPVQLTAIRRKPVGQGIARKPVATAAVYATNEITPG